MVKYKTKSTSRKTAEVIDISLDENPGDTRKAFRGMIVDNQKNPEESVRGHIVHQRKNRSEEWEDVKSINLNTLKGGEGVKLELKSHQSKKLYNALSHLYKIAEQGVPQGEIEWTVEEADKILRVDKDRRVFVQQLLNQDFGDEVWKELIEQDPDLATKLANARIQQNRVKALNLFAKSLKNPEQLDEPRWQNFFENNQWIFGYGLNYQFMHLLGEQADYGGVNYTGRGAQKGDFLMNTSADIRFTVLVEIKKPDTPLFQYDRSRNLKKHRNGAILLDDELTGGVSQLQSNCYLWDTEGSQRPDDFEQLSSNKIYTYQPKGILVIGHTKQLSDSQARSTFELFRRNTGNPEIITYDELYERAKFIVSQNEEQKLDKQVQQSDDKNDFLGTINDEMDNLPF